MNATGGVQSPDGTRGETWNPVRGCSRVSKGCENCYAERQAHRFSGPGQPYEGLTTVATKNLLPIGKRGRSRWTGEVRFVPEMLDAPLRWRKPRMVFVNSMSDLFHEKLTDEQIAAVFGVMAACPQHTFQLLTKRPRRMLDWFGWISKAPVHGAPEVRACMTAANLQRGRTQATFALPPPSDRASYPPWPLPNVWLGVSVENQKAADERIPLLLKTPAAVRWVSCEPLLGTVDLERVSWPGRHRVDVLRGGTWEFQCRCGEDHGFVNHGDMATIDWTVVGAEAGPGARPMDENWVRSIREQCIAAGVSFFYKQRLDGGRKVSMPRLDGVQWAQFPEVTK